MPERELLNDNDAFLFLMHSRDYVVHRMSETGIHDYDALHMLMAAMSSVMVGAKELIY